MTSSLEEANVAEGMEYNVRSDGRTLLQARTCIGKTGIAPHADGSCLADLSGSVVLATIQASVVPVNFEEGLVIVRIDCAPSVVACYARNIGTASAKFRPSFLGGLSSTISSLFGSSATARESTTEVVTPGDADESTTISPTSFSPLPLRDLYCGGGFGFKLTVDVQIMQGFGGSIVSATSFAVRGALASLKLPHVSVSQSPMGYSVEVNKAKLFHKTIDWSESPVAFLFHTKNSRFLVDPTLSEEASLPLHAIVAFGSSGRVSFLNLSAHPSKRVDAAYFGVKDLRQLLSDAADVARTCITAFDQQLKVDPA
jgi:exosome complex RNA-binding protein Rrp42 (RNase PH superfamily)